MPGLTRKKSKKKKAVIICIIAAVLVIIGAAAAVIIINNGNNGNDSSSKPQKEDLEYWQTAVPDVIGKEYDEADKTITESRLHSLILDTTDNSDFDKNVVAQQSPESRKTVNKGTVVNLILSSGGKSVFVPDVSGYEESYATDLLNSIGLTVKKNYIKSDDVLAPGSSVCTNKDPGTSVKKGGEVELTVIKKTEVKKAEKVTVPDITGLNYYKAQQVLKENELYIAIEKTEYSSNIPEKQVMAQNIKNASVEKGTVIKVTVSLGRQKEYVPDITYRAKDSALKILKDAGFSAKIEEKESKTVAIGTVCEQNPSPGTLAETDSEITVYVSKGYEIEVPDVIGLGVNEAVDKIVDSELSADVVFENDASKATGAVIGQLPAGGEKLRIGETVTLTVNKEDEETTSTTTMPSSESTTEKDSQQDEIKTLTATDKDFSNFTDMFDWIASQSGSLSYNSKSDDALPRAMNYIYPVYSTLYDYFSKKYGWEEPKEIYSGNFDQSAQRYIFEQPDPLGQVKGYAYVRLDGDKVDWILKNILNVTPDHSFNSKKYQIDEENYGRLDCYYYNGYYYYETGDGGDIGYATSIESETVNESGQYVFKLAAKEGYSEESAPDIAYKYTVVAELVEVDGGREWKIISIKTDYCKYDY